MITESEVRKVLEGGIDPELHKSLIELGMVRDVRIEKAQVDISPALTTLACPFRDQIVSDVKEAVGELEGVQEVEVELGEMTDEEKRLIGVVFLGRLPIDPEIARLCDAGHIEEYGCEAFAPIAEKLVSRAPEAQPSTFIQAHADR